MRLRHFYAFLSLALVAVATVGNAVSRFAERAVVWAITAIAGAAPFDFRSGPFLQAESAGAAAGISPALYQSNRHEAGVSRRSSARNV